MANVDATLTFSIAQKDVGRLIGKAGCNIKEIREKTRCRIDIGEAGEMNRMMGRNMQSVDIIVKGRNEEDIKHCQKVVEENLGYNSNYYEAPADDNEVVDWAGLSKQADEAQKAKWEKCPPLTKCFYREHKEVAAMSPEQVDEFRESNNKTCVRNFDPNSSEPLLNPCPAFYHCFEDYPDIMRTINKQGFAKPSPIQAQAWPYLLKGKDVIAIAQTGTGKTLAFLMPAFIHIDNQPIPRTERNGPNVLIMCPTRELALQIEGEVKKYEYHGIKSVCVYGGGDRKKQVKVVTDGVQIIIATPGRLNDFVQAGLINVESITYLILDEADRMLDMGFEPQIRKILLDIRPDRQTVMTSATWPAAVRRMATTYMTDPVTIFIGSLDLAAVQSVSQNIIFIDGGEDEKREILMEFFKRMEPDDKVMVFVGKKSRADDISSNLALKDIPCQSIHGDREQSDREQALIDLKAGTVKIMIATDVASRGIDIHDITHVINFDFPRDIEEYVHRVGRTGRAGKTGTSITFMERRDRRQAQQLIDILTKAGQEIPDELEEMAEKYKRWKERDDEQKRLYGNSYRSSGNGCFLCGEEGHQKANCPKAGIGGSSNNRGRGGWNRR